MRITLSIDGGFAYLPARSALRTLDVDTLPQPARAELCALVDALRQSPPRLAPSQIPDARTYTVAIDDGAHSRSYRFSDPISDARCAALVNAVREHLA